MVDKYKETKYKWRIKNKDKIRIQRKLYRKTHRVELNKKLEEYRNKYPWVRSYYASKQRCKAKRFKYYYGRGIEFLMSREEVKYMWFRDKAYLMDRPSIDRINSDENYTFKNCRFLELSENSRRAKLKGGK